MDYSNALAAVQEAFDRPDQYKIPSSSRKNTAEVAKLNILMRYVPLRNVAVISVDGGNFIRINLVSNDSLDAMKTTIKRKVLDLFWLLRLAIEEENGPVKPGRMTMTMDFDFSEGAAERDARDIDRVKSWMDEVSRCLEDRVPGKLMMPPLLSCLVIRRLQAAR